MLALVKNIASLLTLPANWWVYALALLFVIILSVALAIRWKKPAQPIEEVAVAVKPAESNLPTQVASAFLDVSLETKERDIRKALTHSLGLFLMSDLCGLLDKTEQGDQFAITQMFDLIREDYLADFLIPTLADVAVSEAVDDNLPLLANGKHKQLAFKQAFQNATGYNAAGNLMIIPLSSESQAPAILCLTPYTQREFINSDVNRLFPLKDKLIEVLSRANNLEQRATAAETLRLSLKQLTRNHSQIQEQLTRSQRILEVTNLKLNEQKAETTEEVSLWVERQQTLESEIDDLTRQIAESLAAVSEAKEIRRQRDALEKALQENKRNLAELNATLTNAQGVINRVMTGSEPADQVIIKPSSEPSFITSTSDYLSAGASSNLAANLNDSIHQTAAEFALRDIKLSARIEQLDPSFEHLAALTLQLVRLMQVNAYKASPNQAVVEICVSAQRDEHNQPALELLVTDQGGGLSPEEQAHFMRFARSTTHPAPAGVGDPQALRETVALVNQAGGHLWIHSDKDQLTTYRVLLPVKTELVEKSQFEK